MLDAQATCLRASEFSISTSIELSPTAEAGNMNMHRLLGLFDGILRDIGERTRSPRHADDCEASIHTVNFEFTLTRRDDNLNVTLTPTEYGDADENMAQDVMTRLLRAAFPVIRPVRIHFQGDPADVDLDQFMVGVGGARPKRPTTGPSDKRNRRVRPAPIQMLRPDRIGNDRALASTEHVTPSRPTRGKDAARPSASGSRRPMVYGSTPNLPALVPKRREEENRFQALRLAMHEEDAGMSPYADNLYPPEAPWRIILSWMLIGIVATLFLPAAAAIAALNVLKGTNLRINALAMSATAAAVIIYTSCYATDAVAMLEPLDHMSSVQVIEIFRALFA